MAVFDHLDYLTVLDNLDYLVVFDHLDYLELVLAAAPEGVERVNRGLDRLVQVSGLYSLWESRLVVGNNCLCQLLLCRSCR